MLETLHISNYALIDHIDIHFHPGLNIITGETGAGKSIILGALSLLLGGRADNRTISRGDVRSVIEATFIVENNEAVSRYCRENDLEYDDTRLIMRRELSPSGRSRSFINDSPVRLTDMQQLGALLIDIHSQNQNQLLASPDFQRKIIDAVAENGSRLEKYASLFNSFRTALKNYKTTRAAIERDRDSADFMQFQLDQLDELNPHPAEMASLEKQRDEAAEQTELRSFITEALDIVSEGSGNMLQQTSRLQEACHELEHLFPAESNVESRLRTMAIELSDIATMLNDIADRTDAASDTDLETLEQRINAIHAQMRKHNVQSEDDLIEIRNNLRTRLDNLENATAILEELEHEARACRRRALEAARIITERRIQAANDFGTKLHESATPLGMKNLTVDISVTTSDMSVTGVDNIDFRFAFNKNQTPTSIAGAASGGEVSRLMLSVKSIVAEMFDLPTIIFDEVDTGVSGDIATRMGQLMLGMSHRLQVIAITHLPTVAALGNHHFKVFKEDDATATHTHIEELTPERRVDELALMLSGRTDNPEARATATALLNTTNR